MTPMDSTPRKGIERKLLTSILWIAIVPLGLALVLGYVAVRQWQETAARETLRTAAEKTANGVRLACAVQFRAADRLASEPAVIDVLRAFSAGEPVAPGSPLHQRLDTIFEHYAISAPDPDDPAFSLYGPSGEAVVSSRNIQLDATLRPLTELTAPGLFEIGQVTDSGRWIGAVGAPVRPEGTDHVYGYVSVYVDLQSLVEYVLGVEHLHPEDTIPATQYQVAFVSDGQVRVASVSDSGEVLRMEAEPSPRLVQQLLSRQLPVSDTLHVPAYPTPDGLQNVTLAYKTPFDGVPLYIMVYKPESEVYRQVNTWALIACVGTVLIMAVLCLNAYRNVHHNIVRNLLLLNEGAQIIGQGDFDLRLKIDTGDEIEQLADSFNGMAQALRQNIRQLEESEKKYRNLVNSMRDGIIQTDPSGNIGLVNPTGAEIFGFNSTSEIVGKNVRELLPEERQYRDLIRELNQQGFIERSRVWITRKDGTRVHVEVSGNVIQDENGQATGMEAIFRDVSKGVQLERESRERAERISAINQIANVINSSLEAGRLYESLVVEVKKLVDFDFASISLLNEAGDDFEMRRLWPEQGEIPVSTCASGDSTWAAPAVAQSRTCLTIGNLDDAPRPKDFGGNIKSCLCVPLYASGRILGTLNLGSKELEAFDRHDVEVMEQVAPHVAVAIRNAKLLENLQISLEEVTRARERLFEVNEELKTLDEMKTNLLSNVSHELRTPLVAVMGYTDMIYNGKVGPVTDTQKEYLSISLRNIERLVTLIENLLDFSRLHRGTEKLVFDTFDLQDCARTSMEIVRPVAESREISLKVEGPDEPVLVDGDRGKIGQIFNNLLSNAVKFNHHGGEVKVELRMSEDSVEAIVSDTGIGIPPEALDRVFTRFYQYDGSSTRKYGGTGIGLAIAQDIARLHGSRITVASEVNKGTTFRFTLPLKKTRRTSDLDEAAPPLVPQTGLLVELVTQDRGLCTQVRALLDGEGMDTVIAGAVTHALSLARKYKPDCVVIDLDDGCVGDDVVQAFLDDDGAHDRPIVIYTAYDERYAPYSESAASRFKPGFRKSTLLSAIHYAVGQTYTDDKEPLGRKILCVDDDPEVLMFISRCLESEGFQVDGCYSGEDALKKVSSREYGLVLLDIAMPGIDGWETCRRIKNDPDMAGIAVYMVTAKPVDTTTSRGVQPCADGYLMKPFKADDLIELVRGLEGVRASREP